MGDRPGRMRQTSVRDKRGPDWIRYVVQSTPSVVVVVVKYFNPLGRGRGWGMSTRSIKPSHKVQQESKPATSVPAQTVISPCPVVPRFSSRILLSPSHSVAAYTFLFNFFIFIFMTDAYLRAYYTV